MATDLLSESSSPVGMSPRISFSHDLSQSDINEQRLLRSISSSSNADFDFCIHQSFNQESSSAEELFSNGKILPIQVQEKLFSTTNSKKDHTLPPSSSSPPPPSPPNDRNSKVDNTKSKINKEESSNETTKSATGSEPVQKQKSKSFWQFKRSSSLNCGNGYARSLCPLPPLLRSNSTGSSSSSTSKRSSSSSSKESLNHKQNLVNLQKTNSGVTQTSSTKHSQLSSSSNSHQKLRIKKSNGHGTSSHGNVTVRVNTVLNVPSANLFGLGSIFSSNKETKNKKK